MREMSNIVKAETAINTENGLRKGQIYLLKNGFGQSYYILARVGNELYNFIGLSNGNRYTDNMYESELENYIKKTGFILVTNNKITIEC